MSYSNMRDPTFRLIDAHTASAFLLLNIAQDTAYRKIVSYRTVNYVRYPIYSGWMTKTKVITKKIKVSASFLENLPRNPDPLLSQFAGEIINEAFSQRFWPSWYQVRVANANYEETKRSIQDEYDAFLQTDEDNRQRFWKSSQTKLEQLNGWKKLEEKVQTKKTLLERRISRTSLSKRRFLFDVLSLGIRPYLRSRLHLYFLKKALERTQTSLKDNEIAVYSAAETYKASLTVLQNQKTKAEEKRQICQKDLAENESRLNEQLRKVRPLLEEKPTAPSKSSSITLKPFLPEKDVEDVPELVGRTTASPDIKDVAIDD